MKGKKDILEFYEVNKRWLEDVVSNAEYPRILRAAAGAVIEYAIENDEILRGGRGEVNCATKKRK